MAIKPPFGTLIKEGHYFSKNLAAAFLFNDKYGSVAADWGPAKDWSSRDHAQLVNTSWVNEGLAFDGTARGKIGSGAIFAPPCTVIVQGSISSLASTGRIFSVSEKAFPLQRHAASLYFSSSGGGSINVQQFNSPINANASSLAPPVIDQKYRWYAVFESNSSRSLYTDGVHQATDTTVVPALTGLDSTDFGALHFNGAGNYLQFFNGELDWIMVYNNRAFDAEDVSLFDIDPFAAFRRSRFPLSLFVSEPPPPSELDLINPQIENLKQSGLIRNFKEAGTIESLKQKGLIKWVQ